MQQPALQPKPSWSEPSQRSVLISVVALLLVVGLSAGCAQQSEPAELLILHTNDVHARFLETNRFGGRCRPDQAAEGACFGGASRRATAIAAERAAANDGQGVLLLDAGDQFQGTLFYGRYRGQAAATVMNSLRYDGMVVGNHEFDDGPETLARFAGAITFPLLATNVDTANDPSLGSLLHETSIVERNGHKIGLVGYITEETPQLSSPGPTLTFNTIEDELRLAVAALEEQGVDIIIALSHAGFQRDRAVARTVEGIDIIVGGHTNTLLLAAEDPDHADAAGDYPTIETGPGGNPVAVVTAFAWGKYLGRLSVTIENGRLIDWSGSPLLLDGSIEPDEQMAELLAPMVEEVEEFSSEVIGETAVDLVGREEVCRFQECNLGNLITDALLDYGRKVGAEIAFQNGGGIRSSLDAGPITIGQFLEVMPFGNTASTFKLKGSDLYATLEHAVSRADDSDNDGTGRFLQVAGLHYVYTPNQAPGERLETVQLVKPDGSTEDIDPEREYTVVFNAFNRNGGDGFEVLSERAIDPYDQGQVVSDIVIEYIRRHSPIAPKPKGRIRSVD